MGEFSSQADQKNKTVTPAPVPEEISSTGELEYVDTRASTAQLISLQAAADGRNNRSTTAQLQTKALSYAGNSRIAQLQALSDSRTTTAKTNPIQRQENKTGLPDQLKTGMESISGLSLSDVKVHRNSDKPAQLQAHAYAQGTDIHLGPGQEKHLPHELGHVVQQKQGRVKPTMQLKGKVNVNDDAGLEKEADVLGAKALQGKFINSDFSTKQSAIFSSNQPMQFAKGRLAERVAASKGTTEKKEKAAAQDAIGDLGDETEMIERAAGISVGSNYKTLLDGVKPVEEKEDVSDFFFDLWDMITLEGWELDAKPGSGGASVEGAEGVSAAEKPGDTGVGPIEGAGGGRLAARLAAKKGAQEPKGVSATDKTGSTEVSEETPTKTAQAEEEEETNWFLQEAEKLIRSAPSKASTMASTSADIAINGAGNGVVANLQGMVQSPDNAAKVFTDLSNELQFNGSDVIKVYTYLKTLSPEWSKLEKFVASDDFGEMNKYIALFAILRDSKDLVLLITRKMDSKDDLTPEEKESVNALLDGEIGTKVADLLQGTAYAAGTTAQLMAQGFGKAAKVAGEGGTSVELMTQGLGKAADVAGTVANIVPGLGIAASSIEFLRGGWKSIKAHKRVGRLNEIIKEINLTPDDAAPNFAEFKSKMTPLMSRVKKSRARNGMRSVGGAAAGVGAGLVLGGAATAATGGAFLVVAGAIGAGLGAKMLWGQIRAKKEKRQALAEYLFKSSLQDDFTGVYAKKIVKGIIAKEELMGLPDKDLIALIARKIKSN